MDAINRARAAGCLGVGVGFFVAGLLGALMAPHVQGWSRQSASVLYMLIGVMFLLATGLLVLIRSRRA